MKYTKQSILFIAALLLLIFLSNCTETVELRDSNAGTTSNTIQFALSLEASPNDIVGVTTTTRAAVADDYKDSAKDPYIHSLWVVIFNSDGSRYAEPKDIFSDLIGNSVLYWKYSHDLNYDEEQHVYFITNVEDAGILSQLQAVQDEAEMKALKWGLESARVTDPTELYALGKYPKVRMLVASYAVGVHSKNSGGKIYYKRLAPVGFEDATESYATETSTYDALIPVKLVRTYSSMKVEMQRDKRLSSVYHDLYDIEDVTSVFTTFSFTGYAKEYSLFGTTETPADNTALLPTVEYPIKLIGKDPDVEWDEDLKGTLHFYFPSTSQAEKEESMEVQKFNSDGQIIDHIVKYKVPCLDISYNHRGKTHHIFVNAKDGKVFKPNYDYKLPITFYPPRDNIWIVAIRNILTSEVNEMTIDKVQAESWEARTFANELRYIDKKPYDLPSVGSGKKMYSDAAVYYGNIHKYSTGIETVSLGAPAVVADKENLPKWIENIEEKEFRTFNDGSLLLYVQLWVLTPKEIPNDNTKLRGVITFRNKIKDVDPSLSEEQKAQDDVRVYTTFNILARFADMNLGDLNTFANGKTKEFDPYTNEPLYTKEDEGRKGKLYQFGRNIPLDYNKIKHIFGNHINGVDVDLEIGNENSNIPKIWNSNEMLGMNKSTFHGPMNAPWWRYGDPHKEITDPKFEEDPWSWIVNRTYEVYHDKYSSLKQAYVGNNGGDPCPGSDTQYSYYKMPTQGDMSAVFYNEIGTYDESEKVYTKLIPLLDLTGGSGKDLQEKEVNPGGNPNSPDLHKSFDAYYYRKGDDSGNVYAVRYIGTKWEAFYIYEDTSRGGTKGMLVTVAPTPDGMPIESIKQLLKSGKVMEEIDKRPYEKRDRFFPYSPLVGAYGNSLGLAFDLESDSYTDYISNTVKWNEKSPLHYDVFDIDIQGKSSNDPRIMTGSVSGLTIRCIRK